MTRLRLRTASVLAAALVCLGYPLAVAAPALAGDCGILGCPPGNAPAQPSGTPQTTSSPTEYATYSSPPSSPSEPAVSCSVYANGGGMGSYCVSVGGTGEVKSLRERFGGDKLQRCRYSKVPDNIQVPFTARTDGRYLLLTCLANIDLDTVNGGPDRTLDVSVVWVTNGTDTEDKHNGITDYLWKQFQSGAQLPVPFMRTRPNIVPVVGVPTFFTFRWLDPSTKEIVAKGPYAGQADGGPFQQTRERGLLMQAQATGITVDPNQKGIGSVNCRPDTPYREGASPAQQPAGACKITFPRSSASARKYATEKIPANVKDAFNVSVTVEWQVTYGRDGDMRALGDGFTMRVKQVLPVQEVQAPNQPPAVTY